MVGFDLNPVYELIIDDLVKRKYAISDCFFSEAEVRILRNHLLLKQERENFKKAAIGKSFNEQIAKEVRGDFILWMDEGEADQVEQLFFDKIHHLIDYLNRTCYLGICESEFHYARYPEGTFYQRHLDVFQNDDRRTLSLVFYLNDENWQADYGGELALFLAAENGVESELKIQPLAGRMAIFDSKTIEHEVKRVKQQRYSITGWLKTR
ncbi:2OG-Fe(II) oxygenase [Flavobacterium sp. JP2137]|uniref:2OG-Fe(II) oxygenase n=1 Tax=Flavobacterium sp. JP2137 TaxID=3414510 RepID=UPI003D2FB011